MKKVKFTVKKKAINGAIQSSTEGAKMINTLARQNGGVLRVALANKKHHCPHCAKPLTVSMAADGSGVAPQPGDCTFCDGCGHPAVFNDDFSLRTMTADEIADTGEDFDEMWRMSEAIRVAYEQKKPSLE